MTEYSQLHHQLQVTGGNSETCQHNCMPRTQTKRLTQRGYHNSDCQSHTYTKTDDLWPARDQPTYLPSIRPSSTHYSAIHSCDVTAISDTLRTTRMVIKGSNAQVRPALPTRLSSPMSSPMSAPDLSKHVGRLSISICGLFWQQRLDLLQPASH